MSVASKGKCSFLKGITQVSWSQGLTVQRKGEVGLSPGGHTEDWVKTGRLTTLAWGLRLRGWTHFPKQGFSCFPRVPWGQRCDLVIRGHGQSLG